MIPLLINYSYCFTRNHSGAY